MAYVYAHQRKDNGKCFYIGKGNGNRAYEFNRPYNPHYMRTAEKYGVDVVILVNNIPDKKAGELERSFIQQIGLENLTNIQEGGEGGFSHITPELRKIIAGNRKGKKHSEEHKAKLSAAHKGKKMSDEARRNMSIAKTGKKRPPVSDETRAKMSAAQKGKKHTEETKAKLSKIKSGFKHTDETKAKISANNAKYWQGKKRSDETKMKISKANKRNN